jgi:hypothetical protein
VNDDELAGVLNRADADLAYAWWGLTDPQRAALARLHRPQSIASLDPDTTSSLIRLGLAMPGGRLTGIGHALAAWSVIL